MSELWGVLEQGVSVAVYARSCPKQLFSYARVNFQPNNTLGPYTISVGLLSSMPLFLAPIKFPQPKKCIFAQGLLKSLDLLWPQKGIWTVLAGLEHIFEDMPQGANDPLKGLRPIDHIGMMISQICYMTPKFMVYLVRKVAKLGKES